MIWYCGAKVCFGHMCWLFVLWFCLRFISETGQPVACMWGKARGVLYSVFYLKASKRPWMNRVCAILPAVSFHHYISLLQLVMNISWLRITSVAPRHYKRQSLHVYQNLLLWMIEPAHNWTKRHLFYGVPDNPDMPKPDFHCISNCTIVNSQRMVTFEIYKEILELELLS